MKEFIFIRHCESQANAGLSTHLPQTIALTERGTEQSQFIPAFFENSLDLIVTSPFLRTKQTAEPTTLRFPNVRREEWQVQEFTYLSLSKYADTTMEFRLPFVTEFWNRSEPDFCDGEGCESFGEFILRVETLLKKITESTEKTVAVFTHGQFMKAILWLLINNFPKVTNSSMKSFHNFLYSVFVPNAAIFKVFVNGQNVQFSGLKISHLPKNLLTF